MAIQTYISFDQAQETADGRGWKLTHWDDTDPLLATTTEYYQRLDNAAFSEFTVTNKVLTTNVATITTSGNHGFAVGMVVEVTGVDAIFNGSFPITVAATNTFSYAKTNTNVTTAASGGKAKVPISTATTAAITNRVLTSNVVTLTLGNAHSFRVGQWITVALTTPDPIFDGSYIVTAIGAGTVSYAKTNANVTTGATTGTVAHALSASDRLVALYSADTDLRTYFQGTAETTVLAANAATVTSTRDSSLTAEGLVP